MNFSNAKGDPVWHVLALCSGLLFSLMLLGAREYPSILERIDSQVSHAIAPLQNLGGVEFFLAITVLGSVTGIVVVTLGLIYAVHKNYGAILRVFLVLASTSGTVVLAKAFVERARPVPLLWVTPLTSFSFPSFHAAASTALYGSISVLGYRHATHPITRAVTIILPLILIALISLSRVVLSVHYFTDVVAGMLLGAFWLAVVFILPHHPKTS